MNEKKVVLKAEKLNKHFGKKHIIKDVSFDVFEGEIFGFLGPNGSGKTTTIKMIMGLLDIDTGFVQIGGFDREKNFEDSLAQIGGIIENPDTYSYLSGYKNLEIYSRLRGKVDKTRIAEVIKLVGLEKRIMDKVKTYSLGMKQRLGLAQAILHHPKVLVLDEPTNGLDPAGIKELRDILKYLSHEEGIAVFVSSHILSEMELLCDRVCIIDAGKVLKTESIGQITDSGNNESDYEFIIGDESVALQKIQEIMPERYRSNTQNKFILAANEEEVPEVIKMLCSADLKIFGVIPSVRTLEQSFMEITGGGNVIV
ncbi:MAG: ABC transporter ATP-binding protein [Oscillospiraceae bacterium]|nr:ABC transporter ATP-binding protein [Oscillospiraceae bacterium]